MTPGRAFTEPDHSVVWDHSRCFHIEPGEDDVDACDPSGLWTCHAPPGSYCVYGCEVCGENGGWEADPDNPAQCDQGHELEAHSCWVLPWIQAMTAGETYAGEVVRHADGPVVVDEWDGDCLTWRYYSERVVPDSAQAVLA